jgi:two-component system, NarL family, nitrate/nitrite response regulator NarL
MESMTKTRILLIEDNCFIREGMSAVLGRHSDFDVVVYGKKHVAENYLSNFCIPPDVVLLPMATEKENTQKQMLHIKEKLPSTKFILMDIIPDRFAVSEFIRAGAWGFILNDAPIEDYVTTISEVINDQHVLPPGLTNSLFDEIKESANVNDKKVNAESLRLTFRERTVVDLIAEGLSNKEIADRLNIAHPTVKNHVHNILEKLEFSTRFQIALFTMNKISNN